MSFSCLQFINLSIHFLTIPSLLNKRDGIWSTEKKVIAIALFGTSLSHTRSAHLLIPQRIFRFVFVF